MAQKALQQSTRLLAIGRSAILLLEQDESTNEEFINAFQAGHLAYMLYWRNIQVTDTDIVLLFVKQLKTLRFSHLYNCAFLLGRLSTLIQKGRVSFTSHTFFTGYWHGMSDYCQFQQGKRLLTLNELCALLTFNHGNNSSYNIGYCYGFVAGVTQGMQAIKPLIPGEVR